jgi:hypothetical protein
MAIRATHLTLMGNTYAIFAVTGQGYKPRLFGSMDAQNSCLGGSSQIAGISQGRNEVASLSPRHPLTLHWEKLWV